MILVAFFGFLRPSEFCVTERGHYLTWGAVRLSRYGKHLTLRFSTFKHSTSEKKVKVESLEDAGLCPIKAYSDYAGSITRKKSTGPVFAVPAREFARTLAKLRLSAGIKSRITPHSFRHGGATWASKRGWTDLQIRIHGRWSSGAYDTYIKDF